MFSSKSQLQKRTPENGTDRENFLSLLVDEYLNSTSHGKFSFITSCYSFGILSLLYRNLETRPMITTLEQTLRYPIKLNIYKVGTNH